MVREEALDGHHLIFRMVGIGTGVEEGHTREAQLQVLGEDEVVPHVIISQRFADREEVLLLSALVSVVLELHQIKTGSPFVI